jgi:hypothetical protein
MPCRIPSDIDLPTLYPHRERCAILKSKTHISTKTFWHPVLDGAVNKHNLSTGETREFAI